MHTLTHPLTHTLHSHTDTHTLTHTHTHCTHTDTHTLHTAHMTALTFIVEGLWSGGLRHAYTRSRNIKLLQQSLTSQVEDSSNCMVWQDRRGEGLTVLLPLNFASPRVWCLCGQPWQPHMDITLDIVSNVYRTNTSKEWMSSWCVCVCVCVSGVSY